MRYDPTFVPYPSIRYPVYAGRGMVCASSALASAAGLAALTRGGNAVDAAVATAAALTVVEPTANGIGSDAFALVWIEREKKLYGLNASGVAPRSLTLEAVQKAHPGADRMPAHGWTPTMVPGAPKAWAALARRFGRLSLAEALSPAVSYAREGYPVSANLSRMWTLSFDRFSRLLTGPVFDNWYRTFAPDGAPPRAGDVIRLPDHAATLEKIAASGGEDFYKGELADRIVRDSEALGGFFSREDLADYDVDWVKPASIDYRGYTVCEIPPNGQGIVALMALNILKEFSFTRRESVDTYHKQWEAMKIAFADGLKHITDPARMAVDSRDLLSPAYGALRAREIGDRAGAPVAMVPPRSGTVYFCTADGEGNMVSFIQSNYTGFGSGVVVRGTGISLQNRGHDFSLNPADINCLAPGKKCYHTIIPGFLMKGGEAVGPFGVMGGYMQPQGHVQVAMNLIDFDMNPQQALDAPRWQWRREGNFQVESTFDIEIAKALAARGHGVEVALDHVSFGRGQVILRRENGVLVGGTEGRTDSNIACY